MKLIDKDALIEKLWERRIKHRNFGGSPYSEYGHEDDEILSLINTLEVKEVDLEIEQMMTKVVDGDIIFDYYGDNDKTYGCIAYDSFCLEDFGLKNGDKVKVIVIKED